MSEPRTEAGRGQHKTAHKGACPAEYDEECWKLADILAIEQEAAAPQPLDVDTLTDIIEQAIFETDTALAAAVLASERIIAEAAAPQPLDVDRLHADLLMHFGEGLSPREYEAIERIVLARLSRKEPSDV